MTARLLWTAAPKDLRRPNLIWTAATDADVRAWRAENTWADSIQIVLFQADREGDSGPLGDPYAEVHQNVPWRVIGAPGVFPGRRFFEGVYALHGVSGPAFPEAVWRHRLVVRHLARFAQFRQPAWTIFAEADGGVLAVELARAYGGHVALSSSPVGPMAASMAAELGVAVLNAEQSDQFRKNRFHDEERQKGGTRPVAVRMPGPGGYEQ